MRWSFILHRFDEIEVIAAHRRAKGSDPKYDLIPEGEGNSVEDVAADEGCQDEGDGKHDVARASHVRAEPVWHGFGEEGIEADTKRGEGDRHEESDENDGDDLRVVVEQPGQEDEEDKADTIENR